MRTCRVCGGTDFRANRCHRCKLEWQRQSRKLFPEKTMLRKARQRAQEAGVPCTITVDDIVIPDRCPALDIPLRRRARNPSPGSPTLDRLIPEWGYVPGNVVVISAKANMIKSSATASQLMRVAHWMQTRGLN